MNHFDSMLQRNKAFAVQQSAGENPKTGSLASMPSSVTFVQLGRIPLIEACPTLTLESSEGAALGVGAMPGSKSAA